MRKHSKGWDLKKCASNSSESWLKGCIGTDFDMEAYLSKENFTSGVEDSTTSGKYSLSLPQQCEYSWYQRLLKSMSDGDRSRLMSNSGPTQTWVTALPLAWKNWNLSSREWLIAVRRRLGLPVRTKRTRCSNCNFHEIGLKGDHALRCKGKLDKG